MERIALFTLAICVLACPAIPQRRTGSFVTEAHPRNDHWTDVRPMALNVGEVIAFSGDNTGATIDGDLVPGSVLDHAWGHACVWHAFTTVQRSMVTMSYCGTAFEQPGAFVDYLFTTRPDSKDVVRAVSIFPARCGDGNYAMHFPELPPGTYYIAVGYLSPVAEGVYLVTVSAERTEADL